MGKKELKFNYHTLKYEFVDSDMDITYNEYENKYEYGNSSNLSFNPYTNSYTKKTNSEMCIKYNPYSQEYEQVPCSWDLVYNEYENKYEFAPKGE